MIVETAKMSQRGQIVIPKEIRDQIGVRGNETFTFYAPGDGTVIMKRLDTERLVKEFRDLRAKAHKVSEKEIDDAIHAYRAEKRRLRH